MDIQSDKWATRLVKLANEVASWSKDKSTKVGAVITTSDGRPVSWGFNGLPFGVEDTEERKERPLKYKFTCHAERNAMDLAPVGDLSGYVMFVTFSPCSSCAQSIIQKRLSTVVIDSAGSVKSAPERWTDDMSIALSMLAEAGVKVQYAKNSVQ